MSLIRVRAREGRKWYRRYYDSSVAIPSPEVDVIADAARTHNVYIEVGVIEKDGGTLYCTALLIGRDGSILLKHRKVSRSMKRRRYAKVEVIS
jgi:predicted amidohydrolase